jgi:DNA replicative helicase MCM subunit Mcm2 (Cdc46/Mcm family)
MARLRFSEIVEEADVDEALRLMEESQRTVAEVHCKNR